MTGAPFRKVVKVDILKGCDTDRLILECEHVVERRHRHQPSRRTRCEECKP